MTKFIEPYKTYLQGSKKQAIKLKVNKGFQDVFLSGNHLALCHLQTRDCNGNRIIFMFVTLTV